MHHYWHYSSAGSCQTAVSVQLYEQRNRGSFFVEILFFSQIKLLWQTCFCFVSNSHAHKAFLNRERASQKVPSATTAATAIITTTIIIIIIITIIIIIIIMIYRQLRHYKALYSQYIQINQWLHNHKISSLRINMNINISSSGPNIFL